jgi:hypothetical protein
MSHHDLTHAVWRTSSYTGEQGACVELAGLPAAVAVRDTKDRGGPVLMFGREEFAGLAERIKAGQLDL